MKAYAHRPVYVPPPAILAWRAALATCETISHQPPGPERAIALLAALAEEDRCFHAAHRAPPPPTLQHKGAYR